MRSSEKQKISRLNYFEFEIKIAVTLNLKNNNCFSGSDMVSPPDVINYKFLGKYEDY